MAIKHTYVYRDGKIVEITKGVEKRNNVQTFGKEHDDLHSCHVLDEVRQQHMIDSNRAENAYNKERGL
ncbi:MAG: hypothetical protein ACYSTG_05515 [Planctomycetota bacterium]